MRPSPAAVEEAMIYKSRKEKCEREREIQCCMRYYLRCIPGQRSESEHQGQDCERVGAAKRGLTEKKRVESKNRAQSAILDSPPSQTQEAIAAILLYSGTGYFGSKKGPRPGREFFCIKAEVVFCPRWWSGLSSVQYPVRIIPGPERHELDLSWCFQCIDEVSRTHY